MDDINANSNINSEKYKIMLNNTYTLNIYYLINLKIQKNKNNLKNKRINSKSI